MLCEITKKKTALCNISFEESNCPRVCFSPLILSECKEKNLQRIIVYEKKIHSRNLHNSEIL